MVGNQDGPVTPLEAGLFVGTRIDEDLRRGPRRDLGSSPTFGAAAPAPHLMRDAGRAVRPASYSAFPQ